jgi:hypothetical protein
MINLNGVNRNQNNYNVTASEVTFGRGAIKFKRHLIYPHGPKEILVSQGGFHSTPLLAGSVRRSWTDWTAYTLRSLEIKKR